MNRNVVVSSTKPTGWSRSTSVGSSTSNSNSSSKSSASSSVIPSPPSSELCALIGFAYQLGSTVQNGSNSDVRREAKLLMSLSCSSPAPTDDERASGDINNNRNNSCTIYDYKQSESETSTMASTLMSSVSSSSTMSSASSSGRITPTHSVTSISSGGSLRRDTFCFTCPSLSLGEKETTTDGTSPGTMLSRTLKVGDKDAMRLSSEAMARNIIESFQKAIVWRIQSWVGSLSRVLVMKELELKMITNKMGNTKEAQQLLHQELYFSKEALLIKTLGKIEGKVQVLEATTAFKVLNKVSQVDETGSALKKRRKEEEEEDRTGLGEGEYVYDVAHVLEMQCSLNISTLAGNAKIDLNVPGKINGTFLSSEDEDCDDRLTDVTIDLNTDMMASMIEKSSRIAVRASTEAMFKGDLAVSNQDTNKIPQEQVSTTTNNNKPTITIAAASTRSPKRKVESSNVSGLVVITPARTTTSSPSSFGDSSDSDGDQPVILRIPSSFPSSNKIHQPHAYKGTSLDFAARLPPKKYMLQQKKNAAAAVITPLKTKGPEYIEREKGPNLPILMEAASFKK